MAQLTRTADQPLALSDVQAFFGRLSGPTYPGTGGFGVDNVGTQTVAANSQIFAPALSGTATGGGLPDIEFSSAGFERTSTSDRTGGFLLINNTGSDIVRPAVRLDVGITITSEIPGGTTINLNIGVDYNDESQDLFADGTDSLNFTASGVQQAFSVIDDFNSGANIWGQGVNHALSIYFGNFQSSIGFTYRVDFIRLRLDGQATAFDPTGPSLLNYPPARGFAYEDYNEVTMDSDGTWPNAIRPLLGSTADINIIGNRPDSEGSGAFQIGSGGSQTIRRVDVGIRFDNIPSPQTTPQLRITLDGNPGTALIDETRTLTSANNGELQVFTNTLASDVTWDTLGNFDTITAIVVENEAAERGFTYTIEYLRFSSTTEPFDRQPERLSWYAREGGIVPGMSGGGGPLTYPTTGGIAIDGAGSQTLRATDSTAWPSLPAEAVISGQTGNNGFDYTSAGVQGVNAFTGGRIINNTGNQIDLSNARLDIGITFTRLPTGDINPQIFSRLINMSFNVGFTITETVMNNQVNTQITFSDTQGERMWSTGSASAIGVIIFDNTDPRDYDFTVDFIRLRVDGRDTPFAPTGGGGGGLINETIPTDGSVLRLSQLRNVDDGED